MSLTVVSAMILASIVAPQLRSEVEASLNCAGVSGSNKSAGSSGSNKSGSKKRQVDPSVHKKESILEYLQQHASQHDGGRQGNLAQKRRRWSGEIPADTTIIAVCKQEDNQSFLELLYELANLSPGAVISSIWCTCETSGSTTRTNRFLQCNVCRISCCRNCISTTAGYNLCSHDTIEVEIGTFCSNATPKKEDARNAANHKDARNAGEFQTKLRQILPPSLHLTRDGIDEIAAVDDDCYRIRGLEKFSFGLHRIKRDRGKWLVVYYARENNGLRDTVAELRFVIGEIHRGGRFGVMVELTSFMPARTEPLVFGKLDPCCKTMILHNDGRASNDKAEPLVWLVKETIGTSSLLVSGQGMTLSHRVEVGLTESASAALEEHARKKPIEKKFKEAKRRGEQRRWLYPDNWKEWPKLITVAQPESIAHTDAVDSRVFGTYKRADCRQTTNHSALWIKAGSADASSEDVYILLKPNVNCTGPDHGIISTSLDHDDTSSILVDMNQAWQPCDALVAKHEEQTVTRHAWKPLGHFNCIVPRPEIEVKTPTKGDSLVLVSGLGKGDVPLLCRGGRKVDNVTVLNVYSGQTAQQVVRVINSTVVADILKHAAKGYLKYDLGPQAKWETLEPSKNLPFGSCKKTVPVPPTEDWHFNEERRAWERSSEPGASRKYYLHLQEAPKPFAFCVDEEARTMEVKLLPDVVAHRAANNLLAGRHVHSLDSKDNNNVTVSFRLSDIAQQVDPRIEPFKVLNCSALEPTTVDLHKPHQLYERQQKVVTKMLAIENQSTIYTELEMSEYECPGSTGFSLIAKAERETYLRGGVIADGKP